MAYTYTEELNISHISSDKYEHYESARSNFFIFTLYEEDWKDKLLYPHVNPDTVGEDISKVSFDAGTIVKNLRLNVSKASVPNFTVGVKEYRRGNDVIKFAGVPEFKEGSLTIEDTVGTHVKDMLYAWQYLAYNPLNRKGGRMAKYKKRAVLSEYTQDYKEIRQWELEGCWVTGIEEGEFDREGGDDKRQLTVSLAYDRAIMTMSLDADGNPVI